MFQSFPMVFVRSQHRPEITMYSSIMLYVFYVICYVQFVAKCTQKNIEKSSKAQKIVNYFDNASDVFWMENKCYCHCRNPLQMKQKRKSTHKWKLKWQIIPRVFLEFVFHIYRRKKEFPDNVQMVPEQKTKQVCFFQLKLLIFQSFNDLNTSLVTT